MGPDIKHSHLYKKPLKEAYDSNHFDFLIAMTRITHLNEHLANNFFI